jgi:hypothetical protein
MRLSLAVGFALGVLAPASAADSAETISLAGRIDFHAHSGPDTVARSLNSFEVVRQARAAGMRALVLKNHYVSTAALAQLAMQEVGGIEVFGGIALNRSAGGINAEAVRRMVLVEGKRGKVVWLPTFDAENQVRSSRENRPFVAIVQEGRLVPALVEVFQVAAENNLVLATGHSSAAESLLVLEAARQTGVKHLLVTHALTDPTRATLEQMKRMAAFGAVMEFTWLAHLGNSAVPVADAARAIREVGAEHFLVTSDLGQANNPPHVAGLRAFIGALKAAGVTEREIDLITRANPARLLGL